MDSEDSKAIEVAKAFGYMTILEVDALRRIAARYNREEAVLVNIGAGSGTSGLALREGAPLATIFTIDISTGGPHGGLENERNAFKDTGLKLPEHILGRSQLVGLGWQKRLDVVFIDGNHQREGIVGDIEAWLPKVAGVIAFHDYGSNNWPAVKEAVDEFFSGYETVEEADTLIAFRIPQK